MLQPTLTGSSIRCAPLSNLEYIGALLLSDRKVCKLFFDALLQNRFKPLREIAAIDLSYSL